MSRSARRFFIALMVATLIALGLLLLRLAPALLAATMLAVLLWPAQRRLAEGLGDRRRVAAGVLVGVVTLLIVLPIAAVSSFVAREAGQGLRFISETVEQQGVRGLISRLPGPLRSMADGVLGLIPSGQSPEQVLGGGGDAASAAGRVAAATGSTLVQVLLMLVALFFLLAEGRACVAWLTEASPLLKRQTRELLGEVRNVARSVILAELTTAAVQAAAALVAFLIARVPQPIFWAVATFVIAPIPTVGAAAVVCAAALLLLASGQTPSAIFLIVWGLAVVGLIDNVVRPLLIKDEARAHGAVVFFALLGGLAAFGAIGLLIGPLAAALVLAMIRIYYREVAPRPRVRAAAR